MEEQKIEQRDPFLVLRQFHFEVHCDERQSESDAGLTKLYLEGIEEDNLEKIYHFVHAVEIGCGFRKSSELEACFQEAYRLDAEKACLTIDSRKMSVVDAISLLLCMKEEQILFYMSSPSRNNPVLLFEAVRYMLKDAAHAGRHSETVAKAVVRLTEVEEQRFQLLIRQQEYRKSWYSVLTAVLEILPDTALLSYCRELDLEHRLQDIEMISKAFFSMNEKRGEYVFRVISKELVDRWTLLCEKQRREHKYHNAMFLTGYANVLVQAMAEVYQGEEWEKQLDKALKVLYEELYQWYKKETQLQSIFFLNVTSVYFLLLSYPNETANTEIQEMLRGLKPVLRRFEHAWENDKKEEKKELETLIERHLRG